MTGIPRLMQGVLAEIRNETLRLLQVRTPERGPDQVLVRVAASEVNPLDVNEEAVS